MDPPPASRVADPRARARRVGSIVGLVVGDAVGTTNEFQAKGSFIPLMDMVGGGPFHLPAGAYTDDGALALCLAESLVERDAFDPADQLQRYVRFWREGYLSSTGVCFDIEMVTRRSLALFEVTHHPETDLVEPRTATNGSITRLAPVVAWAANDPERAIALARASSWTTHGAAESVDGCELLARLLLVAFAGGDPTAPVFAVDPEWTTPLRTVAAMVRGEGAVSPAPPTSYVVDTLACARWCVGKARNFREAVLLAANLGGDADSIAAVTGQLAGAIWGLDGIPPEWIERLAHRERVLELAERCVG